MPHDPGTDGGAPDGFVTGAGTGELPSAGGGGGVPVVAGADDEVGGGAVDGGAWAACSAEQAASTGTARQAASSGRHILVVVGWCTAIVPPRSGWPGHSGPSGPGPREPTRPQVCGRLLQPGGGPIRWPSPDRPQWTINIPFTLRNLTLPSRIDRSNSGRAG
ncbi:hypothetical protein Amsp01_032350 [Amycolatopsis sp. NBRC 101858]|nr:hypothetical protein Amsp01_032350 [Amycolatopsis sp. NBRC 101858]